MTKLIRKLLSDKIFIATAAFFLGMAVYSLLALRSNNVAMIELREKVYQADLQNSDVETPLRELRQYIHAHMNTDPASGSNAIRPPIQLKHRYERLVAAEKQRVADANTRVYTEAQAYCERQNPGSVSGGSRVPCIEQYVSSNGVRENPIPDSLYKFDFVSPRFSFDSAGISLLLAAVLLTATLGRFVYVILGRAK